ncbi:MAG: hypothetical protein AAB518_01075 [Patescibacteria group bacterium]
MSEGISRDQKIEVNENIESPERKQLRELEATDSYVFHGTNVDVEQLEPRQAIDTIAGSDDEPGVHASQVADYAIFMAVAAPLGHSRSGATESNGSIIMDYGVERAVMNRLSDQIIGWVYVFNKKDFRQRRPVEWISDKPVKPIFKIKVSKQDLPKNIEVF